MDTTAHEAVIKEQTRVGGYGIRVVGWAVWCSCSPKVSGWYSQRSKAEKAVARRVANHLKAAAA